jgi:hypothetical protein
MVTCHPRAANAGSTMSDPDGFNPVPENKPSASKQRTSRRNERRITVIPGEKMVRPHYDIEEELYSFMHVAIEKYDSAFFLDVLLFYQIMSFLFTGVNSPQLGFGQTFCWSL